MVAMSNPQDSATIHGSAIISPHLVFNPSSFVGSTDDLRKLVAQEREKHRQLINESLSALKRLHAVHNGLAPVNSLPAELLGLIFSHLVSQGDLRSKPSDFFGYASQRHPKRRFLVDPPSGHSDVVRVSHVCKYWHTVAIRNPWLWTSLPIHHPIAFHLARSKNLPISLSLTRRLSSDIAPALAHSIHRIRSICIKSPLADDIELLWHELSLSAPILEELLIEHLRCNYYLDGFAVGKAGRLPPLFNGQTPSLRVLALRGVPSPFALFPPTLVHLDVGRVSAGPLPPLAELLKMLGNCPVLESLNVRGAWDWDEINNHVLLRNTVVLPMLARIYLRLWPRRAHGLFLSSLSLPEDTDVSVAFKLEEHDDFADALSTIMPPFIPPCLKGFRRLHLIREGMDGRLQAFRHADALSERPALDIDCLNLWAQPPDLNGFFFDWPFDASQIETLVVSLSQENRLSVQGEDLIYTSAMTPDEWKITFWQLPALGSLRVIGLPTMDLQCVLDALEAEFPSMACPGLTTFEIFDGEDMSAFWDDFLAMAQVRRALGNGLKQVELFNCKPCRFRNLELLVGELGVELVVDGEKVEMPISKTLTPDLILRATLNALNSTGHGQ